jgi:hypothetical protein
MVCADATFTGRIVSKRSPGKKIVRNLKISNNIAAPIASSEAHYAPQTSSTYVPPQVFFDLVLEQPFNILGLNGHITCVEVLAKQVMHQALQNLWLLHDFL